MWKPFIFLIHLVSHLFIHQTLQLLALLTDCHNLLNYKILQDLLLFNLRLILQLQWPEPLYFAVIGEWFLTLLYPTSNNLLHIQHLLLNWNLSSSSSDISPFFIVFRHDEILIKMLLYHMFTIIVFFKNCFNKSIDCIFPL